MFLPMDAMASLLTTTLTAPRIFHQFVRFAAVLPRSGCILPQWCCGEATIRRNHDAAADGECHIPEGGMAVCGTASGGVCASPSSPARVPYWPVLIAGVAGCTTERQNTHVIDRREVLYRWHPWFGRSVYVHEVIDKPGVTVFRCNLPGSRSDRSLEVPVWMFDRAACAGCRGVDTAHVGLDTLTVLAELVRDTGRNSFDKSYSSSRAGAALDSEPTIRRSANAAQNDDDATRVVSGDPLHSCDTNPALAEPARRDAASANAVDGAPNGGTCRHDGRGELS